jgi:hypothetical protein
MFKIIAAYFPVGEHGRQQEVVGAEKLQALLSDRSRWHSEMVFQEWSGRVLPLSMLVGTEVLLKNNQKVFVPQLPPIN